MINKLLSITSFLLLAIVLYIISGTFPAFGYELSIYEAYSSYFWFFLIAAIACGIVILIYQAFTKKRSRWWVVGLGIVIFSNLILLNLHVFRGYAFPDPQDAKYHLSNAYTIINTGHLTHLNFYPIIHIAIATLMAVTGLTARITANLTTSFFYILYMLSMCLLANTVTHSRKQSMMILAFASVPLWNVALLYIHPSGLSMLMLPLLLYFYHKREKPPINFIANTVCLLILAFFITFLHPITTLFVIAIFLAFGVASVLYRLVLTHQQEDRIEANTSFAQATKLWQGSANVAFIMFIAFFIWYFSYVAIQGNTKKILESLIYHSEATVVVTQYLESMVIAGMGFIQTTQLLINRYGTISLYFFISAIAVLSSLRQSGFRKDRPNVISFTYSILLLITLGFSSFIFFGPTLGESNILRIYRIPILLAIVLNGMAVSSFIERGLHQGKYNVKILSLRRNSIIGLVGLILTVSLIISAFSIYTSPQIFKSNQQVTHMEVIGTRWLMQNYQPDVPIVRTYALVKATQTFILSAENNSQKLFRENSSIPSHFGYEQNDTIAASLKEAFKSSDSYMVICKLDRIHPLTFPQNVRSKVVYQYTEADFSKLNSDTTAANVYECGEFEVWRIYPSL